MPGLDLPIGVMRLEKCVLNVRQRAWPWAAARQAAIRRGWDAAIAANPKLFNGRVFVTASASISDGCLAAELLPTDFASYYHWRVGGFADRSVVDAFGSGLLISSDGRLLLARQTSGHLNAGLTYAPGGFIDGGDVGANDTIDVEASIRREISEETGLDVGALPREPEWVIVHLPPLLAIGAVLRSPLDGDHLIAAVRAGIRRSGDDELDQVCAVRSIADADRQGLSMPDFTRLQISAVLAR